MFHQGCLSLTLVQNFCMRFCKENDSFVNLNEIKDFLCLISLDYHLGVLLMSLHLFSTTIIFRKLY
jgi:hypothetical protein